MTAVDTSMAMPGAISGPADPAAADARTRAVQRHYQAVSVEHAARSGGAAGVATPQLATPEVKLDASSLGPMLLAIRTKLSQQQIKMGKEEIRANMKRQEVAHKQALKQIEKAIKAMEKARAEQAKAKHAGFFGKIFGWVTTVATVVAAAALFATAVAATGGLAAIALGVAGMATLTLATDQMAQLVTPDHEGWFEIAAKESGMSQSDAEKTELGVSIALMGLALILTGAVGLAGAMPDEAVVATRLTKAGEVMGTVAQAGQGGTQIAKGVYDMNAADDQREADEATAKKLQLQKFLAKLQAAQSDERDRLKRVIEELNESTTRVLDMMGGQQATTEQITRNLMA